MNSFQLVFPTINLTENELVGEVIYLAKTKNGEMVLEAVFLLLLGVC